MQVVVPTKGVDSGLDCCDGKEFRTGEGDLLFCWRYSNKIGSISSRKVEFSISNLKMLSRSVACRRKSSRSRLTSTDRVW